MHTHPREGIPVSEYGYDKIQITTIPEILSSLPNLTQAPPHILETDLRFAVSSGPATTQYVQQTQAPPVPGPRPYPSPLTSATHHLQQMQAPYVGSMTPAWSSASITTQHVQQTQAPHRWDPSSIPGSPASATTQYVQADASTPCVQSSTLSLPRSPRQRLTLTLTLLCLVSLRRIPGVDLLVTGFRSNRKSLCLAWRTRDPRPYPCPLDHISHDTEGIAMKDVLIVCLRVELQT